MIQVRTIAPLPKLGGVKIDWNRKTKAIALGIGSIAALLIIFFILRGVLLGMKSGKIRAFSFLNIPTPTATPKPWKVQYLDDFSSNKFGWWLVQDEFSEGCGSESIEIVDQAYVWRIDATNGCVWRQYPELLPVIDFEAYVDVERLPGSSEGDMGLSFRALDGNTYAFFLIDDHEQRFTVFALEGDWKTLIDWTTSHAITRDGVNRVGVLAHGSNFTFFINGETVATIIYSGITNGMVGPGMGIHNAGDLLSARFDNFELFSDR